MNPNLEQKYQEAKEDPALRQDFLHSLNPGIPMVLNIDYKKKGPSKKENKKALMSMIFDPLLPVPWIEVYPHSFNVLENLDDFLSALEDHEGRHCQDVLEVYTGRYSQLASELIAYYNQIRNFEVRECSRSYMEHVTHIFNLFGGLSALRKVDHPFPELNQ